jgi:peptide/nickel transport system ATP-binding protein|tara:strand:+ start:1720 stop:2736 length:1017 start_codon:yes stop_codon:yes gene_type:complete
MTEVMIDKSAPEAGHVEKASIYVEDLVIDFPTDSAIFRRRYMRAVNQVSFVLKAGEALAVVGESGSGKSTCARALCRLYKPTSGKIWLQDVDVNEQQHQLSQRDYAKEVQMIFQDPFGSLNPVHTIRHHLSRPLKIHHPELDDEQIEQRTIEIISRVGLSPAQQTADKYPHELSGGQRQRVAIARALAVGAKFILADEPISMLDVSIRLGILNLMEDMKKDGIGFLYITHDIATARYFAERTAVMYVGHMVEWGNSDSVTQNPQHPYTKLLISAIPEPGIRKDRKEMARKADIPLWTPASVGCPFAERCLSATEQCKTTMPAVTQLAEDHFVRCFLFE